jgi:hypothetical protein
MLCAVTSDELKLTAVKSCGPRLPAHSGFAVSPPFSRNAMGGNLSAAEDPMAGPCRPSCSCDPSL